MSTRNTLGLFLCTTLIATSSVASAATSRGFRNLNEDAMTGDAFSTSGAPQRWLVAAARQWMSKMPDGVSLKDLSIPGTHDSGARFGGLAAATQSWSIEHQLQAGIRFFDIRCRPTGKSFAIHHGPFFQRQMFGNVMNAMVAFLRANPRETILMRWKTGEHTAQKGSLTQREISDRYIARYRRYLYAGNGTVPTLGKARGKIVILRNGAINPAYGLNYAPSGSSTQDYYKVFWLAHRQTKGRSWATLPSKKQLVRNYIDLARRSRSWVFNYLSGSTGMAPKDVARATNRDAYRHIGAYRGRRKLGTVILDYPGDRLVYRIIKSNFRLQRDRFVDVACSAAYVSKFTVRYSVDGRTKQLTKTLTAGRKHRFWIPARAKSVIVKGQYRSVFGYKNLFSRGYSRAPNKTFRMTGSLFKPKWSVR